MIKRSVILLVLAALAAAGCSVGPHADPVQVTVADVEPLPGEGLELRQVAVQEGIAGAIAAARPFPDLAAFREVAGESPLDGAMSFRAGRS